MLNAEIEVVNPEKQPKIMRMTWSAKDLDKLKRLEHPRTLRPSQVNQICKALERGVRLEGHIVLNDVSDGRGKRLRIIDGNHRVNGIELFFTKNPDGKVTVDVKIFDHLSEAEEFVIFDRCNTNIHVTATDKIEVHVRHLAVYHSMQKEFPFPVTLLTPGKNAEGVKFTNLVRAYLGRFDSSVPSTSGLLERIMRLNNDDYLSMRQWADDYVSGWGRPKMNHAYKHAPMLAFAKLYYCNLENLGRLEIVRRVKNKLAPSGLVSQNMAMSGASMTRFLTNLFVEQANAGYNTTNKLFITPEEFMKRQPPL